ncbi:MAG: N-acetylmuramoyl-L-alanine amidase [Phycisphaeraceae bacterium]
MRIANGSMCALLLLAFGLGCATRPGEPAPARVGDEIVVAGQFFHTGTPVVLWMDEGGYDAYRVQRRFAPRGEHGWDASRDQLDSPNRFGTRFERSMSDDEFEQHRHGRWTLDQLRQRIDLFVLHYDACGTSRRCFEVLHDHRCLSVHFMIDVDGTVYQTLDLKERAWHAGGANDRSIGVEIANIGAYPPPEAGRVFSKWYEPTPRGARLLLSAEEAAALRTPGFVGESSRPGPVTGTIHGREWVMYDLTPQQYAALAKLSAALSRIFPDLPLDYPKDDAGRVLTRVLTDRELAGHRGLIGHYHLTEQKIDPGPAVRWDRIVGEARESLR